MNSPFRHHGLHGWPGDFTDGTPATAADSQTDPSATQPDSEVVTPSVGFSGVGVMKSDAGAAGFVIDVNYDSSVTDLATSDPVLFAEFEGAVQTAVQYYEGIITNSATVTISLGWGEVMGAAIEPGAISETIAYEDVTSYAPVYDALQAADTRSAVQIAAAASLPATDPTNGATFEITTAEANVLGLYPANQFVGGFVGIDSSDAWSWSQTNVAPNTYDAVGALEHEISEVLG